MREQKKIMQRGTREKTGETVQTALAAAMLCVLAPVAVPVPFGPVPLTLGSFAVCLLAAVLGAKQGLMCVLLYLLLGAAGLPVFSGFSGGAGVMFGPTGGYLAGYICCAWVVGKVTEKRSGRWKMAGAMGLGMLLCYACGTVWLAASLDFSVSEAFFVGTLPYLPLDTVKIAAAAFAALPLRERLRQEVRR